MWYTDPGFDRFMTINFLDTKEVSEYAHPVSVIVDSRDRNYDRYPEPDEYEVQLPFYLRNVVRATLISAELPLSFYVFRNDQFRTDWTMEIDGLERTITIPDGNYSFDRMAQTLTDLWTEAFTDAYHIRVSIDEVTHRTRIQVDKEGGVKPFSFRTTELETTKETGWGLPYYLGFDRDREYKSDETGVIESKRPAVLFPETYLLLDIDGLNFVHESGPYGTTDARRTFAKIPTTLGDPFAYILWDKPITTNVVRPPIPELQRLRVRFRFHDGTPVRFHGIEHSFTLEIWCTPDLRAS